MYQLNDGQEALTRGAVLQIPGSPEAHILEQYTLPNLHNDSFVWH